jgi:hypothetical protein
MTRYQKRLKIVSPVPAELAYEQVVVEGESQDEPYLVSTVCRLQFAEPTNGVFVVLSGSNLIGNGTIENGLSSHFQLDNYQLYFGVGYEIVVSVG